MWQTRILTSPSNLKVCALHHHETEPLQQISSSFLEVFDKRGDFYWHGGSVQCRRVAAENFENGHILIVP